MIIPIQELRDKRVDRILLRRGYPDANIFYSPIGAWLPLFIALIGTALISYGFIVMFWSPWLLLLVSYFFIAYLTNAWHCCCFALVEGKCCVINPNWPFRKFEVIAFNDIESVTIDEQHSGWKSFFTLFSSNYIEITTATGKERFYCTYLQLDAFDENFTKQTIEDFQSALERAGIPVQMNLEYKDPF